LARFFHSCRNIDRAAVDANRALGVALLADHNFAAMHPDPEAWHHAEAKLVNPPSHAKIVTASRIEVSFLRVEIETRAKGVVIGRSSQSGKTICVLGRAGPQFHTHHRRDSRSAVLPAEFDALVEQPVLGAPRTRELDEMISDLDSLGEIGT
jgi:hypothetical protein